MSFFLIREEGGGEGGGGGDGGVGQEKGEGEEGGGGRRRSKLRVVHKVGIPQARPLAWSSPAPFPVLVLAFLVATELGTPK